MPSHKQKEILRLFHPGIEITKQTIVKNCGLRYYHNAEKYIGEILSRMVAQGLIDRVRPGVFVLPEKSKAKTAKANNTKPVPINDNQMDLF